MKTQSGTKDQIELHRNGKLKTAKGSNLYAGDELEPGDGLISLSLADQKIQSKGVSPRGVWILENDKKLGWEYEINDRVNIGGKWSDPSQNQKLSRPLKGYLWEGSRFQLTKRCLVYFQVYLKKESEDESRHKCF